MTTGRAKRNHRAGAGMHPLTERRVDCYETPPEAVHALLRAERIPHVVWEPAAGGGAIVRVLRAAGHQVIASDIVDYGCPDSTAGVDFMLAHTAPRDAEVVVTNPPFRLAAEFVGHALTLVPLVIMLLRLAFLVSERRSPILDRGMLARVHTFKRRLPMMHRAGWTGPRASSSIAFGWFVWCRYHAGPAAIDRISWKPQSTEALGSTADQHAAGAK
jgi:hypothetical protein